jgi:hypothetical protein
MSPNKPHHPNLYRHEPFLYVSEIFNHCLRRVEIKTGTVSHLAGVPKKAGFKEGPCSTAQFEYPRTMSFDALGNILVLDASNNRVRYINMQTKMVSTFAGTGVRDTVDGPADKALLTSPLTHICDSAGNMFLYQHQGIVRKIDAKTSKPYSPSFFCAFCLSILNRICQH